MERFGFGRSNSDPWFRIGNFDVTTTAFIAGLGIFSMFVWAGEGQGRTVSKWLWLLGGSGIDMDGEIWRLVTWPIAIVPGARLFWVFLSLAFFYLIGSQMEAMMGRKPFTVLMGSLIIIPAIFSVVVGAILGLVGFAAGVHFLFLGAVVALAASQPKAVFWPGIPAPIIAAIFVGIDVLQALGDEDEFSLLFIFSTVLVALFAIRSLGFAEALHWWPKLPLPASLGGEPTPARRRPPTSARKRGRRKGIRVVPPADPRKNDLQDMEIDVLLDQVANQGLDSLTKEQRKRLEDHSKRLRKKDE
ncbi:MAG: hypothetical protein HKN26_17090 [Acidimicrobiales bacterium]|nr:hypothetical protein [Acidimicrobiales bacterium]